MMKRPGAARPVTAAFIVALAASVTGAAAQPAPDAAASRATAAAASDEQSRIITPRKSESAARMKQASAPKDAAIVDWARLRAQIAETRARDGKFAGERSAAGAAPNVAAAPQRPGGIRRIDLSSMKTRAMAAPSQTAVAERAQETRLPILVPASAEVLQSLKVFPLENAYAAHAKLADGTEVHMMGTRLRVVGGDPAIAKARFASRQRMQGRIPEIAAPYVISRHEEGVDLSFSLFNVAYLVTVRCKDPDADPRCTGQDFVGALVRDLGILNADAGEGQ
jgi:hypothetical protein